MEMTCSECDYTGPSFERLYPTGLIFRCGECGFDLCLSGAEFADLAILAAARELAGEGRRLHWGQIAKRARRNNPGARLISSAYIAAGGYGQHLRAEIEAIYQGAIAP